MSGDAVISNIDILKRSINPIHPPHGNMWGERSPMKKFIAYSIITLCLLSLLACSAAANNKKDGEKDGEKDGINNAQTFDPVTVSPTGVPEPTKIPTPEPTVEPTRLLYTSIITPAPMLPMDPPAPSPEITDIEGEYQAVSVWFPHSVSMGMEDKVATFRCDFVLPDGWSIKKIDEPEKSIDYLAFMLESRYFVFDAEDECVGAFGYRGYSPDEYIYSPDEPKQYRVYFNSFWGIDICSFDYCDEDYVEVKSKGNNVSATTTVTMSPAYTNLYLGFREVIENLGVLSYNDDFGSFVALEFITEKITEEQLRTIAESVCFEDWL